MVKKDGHYGCKKIILTDNSDLIKDGVQAINDDFLEFIVNNPSCEKVEVKLIKDSEDHPEIKGGYREEWEYYEIIIPKEEPKQFDECKCTNALQAENCNRNCVRGEKKPKYTPEKLAARRLYGKGHDLATVSMRNRFIEGARWQQEQEQDKNKYSEEEVRDLFKKYQYDYAQWVLRMEDDIEGRPIPVEWFEKNKKK